MTYAELEQAEAERMEQALEQIDVTQRRNDRLQAENERLRTTIENIYTVAHRFEWGYYTVDTAEGCVYRTSKEGLK